MYKKALALMEVLKRCSSLGSEEFYCHEVKDPKGPLPICHVYIDIATLHCAL